MAVGGGGGGSWLSLRRPYCWGKLRRFSSSVKSIFRPFGYAQVDGLRVWKLECVRVSICPHMYAHAQFCSNDSFVTENTTVHSHECVSLAFPFKCVRLWYNSRPSTGALIHRLVARKHRTVGKNVHMELILSGHISLLLGAICFNCLLRSNMASN